MSKRRVFVLGLDGATFDVIHAMRAQGKLPAFGRLMQEGAWGRLESVDNMRSAAAWTSFLTGTNPGKHGIYEFYDYLPESYSLRFINAGIRDGRSVWGILSGKGKHVGVLNVPMTFPAEPVNGFLVAGLDGPSVHSPGFTHPPDFVRRLEQEFGPYIMEPGLTGAVVGGRLREAVGLIHAEIAQKIAITRGLLKSENWDFFISVLRSLDAVQHTFWKYMDPQHPDHNPAEAAEFGRVIPDVYEQIDAFLGELLDTLDPAETTLVVMSDHGFGRKAPTSSQINPWLATRGLLAYRTGGGGGGFLRGLYKRVVGATSRRMKERLWQMLPGLRDRVQSRLCFANIDWSRTRAYSDSLFANVRINLKGREQHGVVEPGAEYEALVTQLVRELKGLRDSRTGQPLVRDVLRKEESYAGPHMGKAPDILVRWREDLVISGIDFEGRTPPVKTGPPVPGEDPRIISGDHHLHGVMLARGPGVKRGAEVQGAKLMDLAPTFLYAMGLPVPKDMDGRVIADCYEPEQLAREPVTFEEAGPGGGPRGGGDYDAAGEAAMHARLRDLGYVE